MSDSCDPMDCTLPGSSVHRVSQARILECVAIPFSRGSSQPKDQTQVSCIAGGLQEDSLPLSHNSKVQLIQRYPDSKIQPIHAVMGLWILVLSLLGLFLQLSNESVSSILKIVART